MKRIQALPILILLLLPLLSDAQLKPVEIEDEREGNRIHLYAVNQNDRDLDVAIKVSGSGFRQPRGESRLFRVPAASKVLIQSLVVERDAEPRYTYELTVREELSKRVVRREAQRIKIDPPKNILYYKRADCERCKDVIGKLDSSYYNYRVVELDSKPEIQEYVAYQLRKQGVGLDTVVNPVMSIGGKVRADIDSYQTLLKVLEEKDD